MLHPDTQAALESGNYAHIVGLVRFDFTGTGGGVVRLATSQFDVTVGLLFSELASMTVGVYNNRYGFRSRSANPFGDSTLPNIGGYPVTELYANVGSDKVQCQFGDPGVQLTGVDTVTWTIEGQSVDMTWNAGENQYVATDGAFADHVATFLNQTVDIQLIGTASGETFVGSGLVLQVGNVNETGEIRIEPASFEFSGADTTMAAIFLNNQYVGAPVWYARAILDAKYHVIGDPIVYMIGTIDGPGGSQDDDEARVVVEAQGPFANFDAVNGRRVNPNAVPPEFAGDRGFEFSGQPLQRGVWGRKE